MIIKNETKEAVALLSTLTDRDIEWPGRYFGNKESSDLNLLALEIIATAKHLVTKDILESAKEVLPIAHYMKYRFQLSKVVFETAGGNVVGWAELTLEMYAQRVQAKISELTNT